MKQLIIITIVIFLASCKKSEPAPETTTSTSTTTPTVTTVPDKTVSITCQTVGGQGKLLVDWNYDYWDSQLTVDSVYYYMPTTIFTNFTKGDSIKLYWSSSTCSTCGWQPSQISVTVNGIVKYSTSNDNGLTKRYIKL